MGDAPDHLLRYEMIVAIGRLLGTADYVYGPRRTISDAEALAELAPHFERLQRVFQPEIPFPHSH
jgi:hypothetical protein